MSSLEVASELKKDTDHLNAVILKDIDEISAKISRDINELDPKGSKEIEEFKCKVEKDIKELQSELERNVEELNQRTSNIENQVVDIKKVVNGMDLKFHLQENKITNGELVWKIDQINLRMEQAKSGKMVTLHSAPCYTGQNQYKFSIRLYLNGDSVGKSTHLSIFIVVMKSPYDAILKWPIYKRIKFELINQVDETKNITKSFISNPKSRSFHRPSTNMNIGSGVPLFVPIEKFLNGNFIMEDCAYIKVTVKDVCWLTPYLGKWFIIIFVVTFFGIFVCLNIGSQEVCGQIFCFLGCHRSLQKGFENTYSFVAKSRKNNNEFFKFF